MRLLLLVVLASACSTELKDTGPAPTIDADGDGWPASADCDDEDANSAPELAEVCDGVDNDCDGTVDEDVGTAQYADVDGDAHGDPATEQLACTVADGFTTAGDDCDDANPDVHPGAIEVCNDVDDDCDGATDENLTSTVYTDGDGDGYGDPTTATLACPDAGVANGEDCDDADGDVNPDATEICNDVDDDCDGTTDEGTTVTTWADVDGDGYGDPGTGSTGCPGTPDRVSNDDDCDDGDDAVNPDGREVCNGVDDDCDGAVDIGASDGSTWYTDADGDGFGDPRSPIVACSRPEGAVADASDCDDRLASVNPAAREECNGVDDDCDGTVDDGVSGGGTWYADEDGDGYGDAASTVTACSAPPGYVADASDCDDTAADIHPGAAETCDGIDLNCDGVVSSDCLCDGYNTDDSYVDGISMGGPSLLFGMRFPAAADETVTRVEVYTGEGTGTNTLSLNEDDGAAVWPAAALGSGSWSMSTTNGWQGVDLPSPVTLTGGTQYWVIWGPVNGAQASWAPSGSYVTYRGSYDGFGTSTGLYSGQVKFRLYCE